MSAIRSPRTAGGGMAITQREFGLFQELIHRKAGIWLGAQKTALLVSRLGRRVRELGLSSFGEYHALAEEHGGLELVHLLDLITTNETRFFREPRHFEFIVNTLVPAVQDAAAAGAPRALRVWSAACSSGEEPYSLAMLLLDALPAEDGWSVDILATDLSSRVLDEARAARWPAERAREIPQEYLRRFMLRGRRSEEGWMKAGAELRSAVRFQRLNLHDEIPSGLGAFDMIFCRNVLIYFSPEAKERVITRLLRHLRPGGHFFLGHAETLNGIADGMTSVVPNVYRRREGAGERGAETRQWPVNQAR